MLPPKPDGCCTECPEGIWCDEPNCERCGLCSAVIGGMHEVGDELLCDRCVGAITKRNPSWTRKLWCLYCGENTIHLSDDDKDYVCQECIDVDTGSGWSRQRPKLYDCWKCRGLSPAYKHRSGVWGCGRGHDLQDTPCNFCGKWTHRLTPRGEGKLYCSQKCRRQGAYRYNPRGAGEGSPIHIWRGDDPDYWHEWQTRKNPEENKMDRVYEAAEAFHYDKTGANLLNYYIEAKRVGLPLMFMWDHDPLRELPPQTIVDVKRAEDIPGSVFKRGTVWFKTFSTAQRLWYNVEDIPPFKITLG